MFQVGDTILYVELMTCSLHESDFIAIGTKAKTWLVTIQIKDHLSFRIKKDH